MKGGAISCGKNERPNRWARVAAGRCASTPAGTRWAIGLYPRKAEKSAAVGGRWAITRAEAAGKPAPTRPFWSVLGRLLDRPTITIVKKKAIENNIPEFCSV